MKYELRAARYELRATSYELRAASCELRAASCELRAALLRFWGRLFPSVLCDSQLGFPMRLKTVRTKPWKKFKPKVVSYFAEFALLLGKRQQTSVSIGTGKFDPRLRSPLGSVIFEEVKPVSLTTMV